MRRCGQLIVVFAVSPIRFLGDSQETYSTHSSHASPLPHHYSCTAVVRVLTLASANHESTEEAEERQERLQHSRERQPAGSICFAPDKAVVVVVVVAVLLAVLLCSDCCLKSNTAVVYSSFE